MTTPSQVAQVLGVSPGPSASAADIANAMATVPSPDPTAGGGDPVAQIIVGVVQSTQFTASPPTVTCTLRGSATQVSGLRFLAGYVPQVGDRVRVAVIGGSHWIVGVLNPSGTLGGAARQTLSSPASSVTFSSVPAGYMSLHLTCYIASMATSAQIGLQFNYDGATHYNWSAVYGNGTAAASASATSDSKARIGYMSSTAGGPTIIDCVIPGYGFANAGIGNARSSRFDSLTVSGMYPEEYAFLWTGTGPITVLQVQAYGGVNMGAGSAFSLAGIP
jgi:hypothetical protein